MGASACKSKSKTNIKGDGTEQTVVMTPDRALIQLSAQITQMDKRIKVEEVKRDQAKE